MAGTLGGLVSTVALYPLELIKTRMQVTELGRGLRAAQQNPYGSIIGSLRVVVTHEGVRGLYKGVTPAIIASSGSWGGYFFFYEQAKARKLRTSGQKLRTVDHLTAGVEAGSILVLLFNPLWLVKTRLALQGADSASRPGGAYKGIFDALRTIVREEGLPGLYKGVVPALLLTSHGAIQFAVYEWLKSLVVSHSSNQQQQQQQQPAWISVLIGGASKIVASTATYPSQVVKSRLQQRDGSPTTKRYEGLVDCVLKISRQEGLAGFFRGVLPNALKVAPSAALTFVVYEELIKLNL